MRSFAAALAAGPLVLDGGLSTELEQRGHDLSSRLWSARLLHDDPDEITAVHRSFLDAGAQVLTTASYQASVEGFGRAGIDEREARQLIGRSVALARAAITEHGARTGVIAEEGNGQAWVAGSAGPYGAMLADGSEYSGVYPPGVGLAELRVFHRTQLTLLRDAGADVLACETVPSLLEVRAIVEELQALGHPGWLSLSTVTGPDGEVRTRSGELASDVFALTAGAEQVVAAGVNCTSPDGVGAAIEVAAQASGKPVVAYPNSGEDWDAAARTWTLAPRPGPDSAAAFTEGQLQDWLRAGARLVGGCCRVGPGAIRAVSRQIAS